MHPRSCRVATCQIFPAPKIHGAIFRTSIFRAGAGYGFGETNRSFGDRTEFRKYFPLLMVSAGSAAEDGLPSAACPPDPTFVSAWCPDGA
jgi:hypothetical protein